MMPFASYYWEHPLLRPYLREITPGQTLFRQQERGRSMFILLSGILELVNEIDGVEQVVSLVEPGEFLGEQSIIRDEPFVRKFGARARSAARVLELDRKAAEKIQAISPPLLIDILKGIFSVASDRLSRANQMINILRSTNNEERLLLLLLHFAKTVGVPSPQGTEVPVDCSTLQFYANMSGIDVHALLAEWEDSLLLSLGPSGYLTIFDETALAANLPVHSAR